jgi:glutamate--cysteine ligase regulatory subunit
VKEQNVKSDTDEFVSIPYEENVEVETSEGKTKTVVKIFLNEYHNDTVEEALNHTLKLCKTAPNVILSYSPTSKIQNDKFIWAENDAKAKTNFKSLWSKLREEKKAGRVEQLGIADMDLDTILDIFEDKHYDFTILQINIATCCMPPPCLVNFCKENEIQLLTHSDPQGELYTW